jgi:NAD(P)H dehydrogenase (quinone)
MSSARPIIFVTGANGRLGRLIVGDLLTRIPAERIVVGVRNPAAVDDFRALGVEVRAIDYDQPSTLGPAFSSVDRLLLISSSEVGSRTRQHHNVIDAAARAQVGLIAYTSILHADTTPIELAAEHRTTEAALTASGVPFALLRNGWYMENYLATAAMALQHGTIVGCSGDGRISAAVCADYARAAAVVLTSDAEQGGRVYELAGDDAFTKGQLAAALAAQGGKAVAYKNLSEADYAKTLEGFGLDAIHAALIAQSDAAAGADALFDDSRTMSTLIGRPTVALEDAVADALRPQAM